MKANTVTLLDAANTNADRLSPPVTVKYRVLASLQIVTTGAPVGVPRVMVSNKPTLPTSAEMDETADTELLAKLDAARTAVINGTPGTYVIENFPVSTAWLQFFYDHTSGSGSITVYLTTKT